ncbi:MAG TPA: hypothetical protein VGI16_13955 [Candidatus Acidoferrum sp.]
MAFYGRPLGLLAYVKWTLRNSPAVWTIPQPLHLEPVAKTNNPTLSYFGYEFQSPSSSVKELKRVESAVVLNFSSCAGMIISKADPRMRARLVVQQALSSAGRDISEIFGPDAAAFRLCFPFQNTKSHPGGRSFICVTAANGG